MNILKSAILITTTIVTMIISGCGPGDIADPLKETSNNTTMENINSENYDNNLDGLIMFMKDCGFISGDEVIMSAQIIGAKKGVKYNFKYNNSNITAEFYEYDDVELQNDIASRNLSNARATGFINILGKEVPAVLSDNGKYLMIYADNSDQQTNHKRTEDIQIKFRQFKVNQ